jgi:hypothetical protein
VVSVLEAADESLRSEGRPIAVQVEEDADA